MYSLLLSLTAPILSLGLFVLSSSFFTTFMSVKLNHLGFDETIIGIIHSMFYIGYLLGSAYIEAFIRRIGHIRAFAAFGSLSTSVLMIQGISQHYLTWMITRLFAGFSMSALYIVIESWLLAKSTIEIRGRLLAFYMFSLYFAQSLSQLLMNYVNTRDFSAFFIAAFLASISIIPLSMTKKVSPEIKEPKVKNIFKTFFISPLGSFGCLLAGIMLSCIYSFTPLFALFRNVNIAWIMFSTIFGGFIFQWPVGKLSDIFDRRKVLIFINIFSTFPCIFLCFIENEVFILSASLLLGGCLFTIYPLSINQVCDRIESEDICKVVGLLSLIFGVGAVIGPLLVPSFISLMGYPSMYLFILLANAILLSMGIYSLRVRTPIPLDQQGAHVKIPPRSTPLLGNFMDEETKN